MKPPKTPSAAARAPRAPFFGKRRVRKFLSNFLPNVLGVIVGIALTLGVSFLIQQRHERRQTHEIMVLLRKELADNKEYLETSGHHFERTFKACGILLSPAWKTMPRDTLIRHITYVSNTNVLLIRRAAWTVFQNSDAFKTFDSKELIVLLSEFYSGMDAVQDYWNTFNERKDEASSLYASYSDNPHAYAGALLQNERSRRFMETVYLYNYYNFPQLFTNMTDAIDYSLYLIDQSGDYQYTFKDVWEDLETFSKAQRKATPLPAPDAKNNRP